MSLHACPDCGHQCAVRAEACPQCGSFFQDLRYPRKIDRTGWATTIAFGVILGWVVSALFVAGVLGFIFYALAEIGRSSR